MRQVLGVFGAFLLLLAVAAAQEGRCVGLRVPSCSSYFTDFVCDNSVADFCSTILDTCDLSCDHGCSCRLRSLGCTTSGGGFLTICESEVSCEGSPTPCELLDEDECNYISSSECQWEVSPPPPTNQPPTLAPPSATPPTMPPPTSATVPKQANPEDCLEELQDLLNDPGVAAEFDKVSQSNSEQLNQCTFTSTCQIDASAQTSFRSTCLSAGGQYFTIDYAIKCPVSTSDFVMYSNQPLCFGVSCDTDLQAQDYVEAISVSLQDFDALADCTAELRGTTPGETGAPPPTNPPPTLAPVLPPTSTPAPVVTPTASTVSGNCQEQTSTLNENPSLTVNEPNFSAEEDCATNAGQLVCSMDVGEANPGYEQACQVAGGQYIGIDTSVTCALTENQSSTFVFELLDAPICLGMACDVDALDDDIADTLKQGIIQGLESDGTLVCSSGPTQPPPPTFNPPTPTPAPVLPPSMPPPTRPSVTLGNCQEQTKALQDDPNVSAEMEKVSQSQSTQFDQCANSNTQGTCVVDTSSLVSSFKDTCLAAGGQFFTFNYEIECPEITSTDLARYLNDPLCIGISCDTEVIAQAVVDALTSTLQDSDNESVATCTAELRGTTPGVTGTSTATNGQPLPTVFDTSSSDAYSNVFGMKTIAAAITGSIAVLLV